jgi:hypothetical protein
LPSSLWECGEDIFPYYLIYTIIYRMKSDRDIRTQKADE